MPSSRSVFLKNLLYILQVPGYIGILTCLVAVVTGEYLLFLPFSGIALITIVPSWLILHMLRKKGEGKIKKPLSLIALSYGVVSLLGAIPLYASALIYSWQGLASENLMYLCSPINALFESFAGFTSSGLSMLKNPADIPYSVQFWRSLSQWVGGLGVFILAALIFSPGDQGEKKLIKTEVGNIFTQENMPLLFRQIWLIYAGFTLLGFVLFLLADQTLWVSLNHALTAASTGGFNVTNESFKYQPLDAKIYSMLLMVFGALGFALYWEIFWKRDLSAFRRHKENLWFLLFLLLGIIWMSAESLFSANSPALIDNVYQWISAITTTGYQTTDIGEWQNWKVLVLSVAMLIGGVGGSTAGGLKISRLMLLYYIMRFSVSGRKNKKYENKLYEYGQGEDREEIFTNFITILGVWLSVLMISVILVSWVVGDSYSVNHIIFEVVSAQSNVGLSIGITSAEMHWILKADFMLLMWMGRLELIAVLVMFTNWLPIQSRNN